MEVRNGTIEIRGFQGIFSGKGAVRRSPPPPVFDILGLLIYSTIVSIREGGSERREVAD